MTPPLRWAVATAIAGIGALLTWGAAEHEHAETVIRNQGLDRHYAAALQHEATALLHDIDMVALLLASGLATNTPPVSSYLAAKRDELAPVRYLARIESGRYREILTSSAMTGFNPGSDPTIERLTAGAGARQPVAGILPGASSFDHAVALVVPDHLTGTMVAVVTPDRLLAQAFHDLPPLPGGAEVAIDGVVVGRWPGSGGSGADRTAVEPVRLGVTVLSLTFPSPAAGGPGPWMLGSVAVTVMAVLLHLILTAPGHRRGHEGAPALGMRLAATLEEGGAAMALVEGNDLRVRALTPGLAAILGVATDRVVGWRLAELLGADPGSVPDGVVKIERPGARAAWVRLMVCGGRGEDRVVMVDDVSQGRSAEARTDAIARLWDLGSLAGALVHDVGQPLNVIRLLAEGALDRLLREGADPERLTRTLANVTEQANRVVGMLEGVRDAARRPVSAPVVFAAVAPVRDALSQALPRLRAEGVRLSWHADLHTPPVSGHPLRLRRAIAALLDNACDAIAAAALRRDAGADGGPRGTVTVRCCRDGAGGVLVSIEDDGIGLPDPVRLRIAGIEAPPATGRSAGLGLTLALGVVAELGGRVASTDCRPGTRLALHLPAAARTPAKAAAANRRAGRRHVLVVDDTVEAATETARYLAEHGWRTTVACGGNPAWRMFAADPADAVVTDLAMPDGDGWSLVARLHGEHPSLPVIVVSTAAGEDAVRAVRAGAAVVLPKPVALADIVEHLDEALAS
ncbi:MAG: hybrid sensor histidine kinase/response regulator [Magnetospirillum sp.]|nr:hybrid sensor histidine kinase/response regulator [Magnetospirillum sp.]